MEAVQNYVKVGYIDEGGHEAHHMERCTLKEVISMTEGTSLAKSHRSYLVNKTAILSAQGNAQGLVLTLAGSDKQVPVSRSMVQYFR